MNESIAQSPVARATPISNPFSYVNIQNVFPEHLYAEILKNLPDKSLYYYLARTGPTPRKIFDIYDDGMFANLDQKQSRFWQYMKDEWFNETCKNYFLKQR